MGMKMVEQILNTIYEMRGIESSSSLVLAVKRSLQIIKSYIGYDVPVDLLGVATEMALLIFDQKGYVHELDGVKSIKEGEVTISFLEDSFKSSMEEFYNELNLFRRASW